MTIQEVIDRQQMLYPHQYGEDTVVKWLDIIDRRIYNNLILTHEGGEEITFDGYTSADKSKTLIVPDEYDVYRYWLDAQTSYANRDISAYNNAISQFNNEYKSYANSYNRDHIRISANKFKYDRG